MKNPKSSTTSPIKNPNSSPLKICMSHLSNPNYYDDEFYDSYEDGESSVETDPKWGRELDSEGEPIYTPEPILNPDREYTSVDAVFSNTDYED